MKIVRTRGKQAKETELILAGLENRARTSAAKVLPVVERIVKDVRRRGDEALREYAAKFDGLSPQEPLEIHPDEMDRAWESLPGELQSAMNLAARQIRRFAELQLPTQWVRKQRGLSFGQLVRPLGSAGCYVPAGRHPLPSTLLMTAIPAKVAGVGRVIAVSAHPAPEVLAAARVAAVDRFFQIGGAQAVAALAYGTGTVPRVDKIVGPGNWYVTAAKRLVAFDCAIDMLAGPTEIAVASESGSARAIAADLVAQAEHDPDALAVFVTTQAKLARLVAKEADARAKANPTARAALQKHGLIFLAASPEEAHAIVNRIAPEHLTVDSEEDLAWVRNAGSVFVGGFSPQPMGDYITGPNHTLPTGGYARIRGGLSVMDFLKLVTVQQYSAASLARMGPYAVALARAEGLKGHAAAVRERLEMVEECPD